MKLSDIKCPFGNDADTLAFTGIMGAAHAAAMIIAPKTVNDKLLEMPKDINSLHASTRVTGVMSAASAITALALSQKEDSVGVRRAALTAQGAALIGVAAIQGYETHKERNKKRLGWATTAVHGGIGAICLYRGLKKDSAA